MSSKGSSYYFGTEKDFRCCRPPKTVQKRPKHFCGLCHRLLLRRSRQHRCRLVARYPLSRVCRQLFLLLELLLVFYCFKTVSWGWCLLANFCCV